MSRAAKMKPRCQRPLGEKLWLTKHSSGQSSLTVKRSSNQRTEAARACSRSGRASISSSRNTAGIASGATAIRPARSGASRNTPRPAPGISEGAMRYGGRIMHGGREGRAKQSSKVAGRRVRAPGVSALARRPALTRETAAEGPVPASRRGGGDSLARRADLDALAVLVHGAQADALHLRQLVGALERPVLLTVGDDRLGLAQARSEERRVGK